MRIRFISSQKPLVDCRFRVGDILKAQSHEGLMIFILRRLFFNDTFPVLHTHPLFVASLISVTFPLSILEMFPVEGGTISGIVVAVNIFFDEVRETPHPQNSIAAGATGILGSGGVMIGGGTQENRSRAASAMMRIGQ